MRFLTHLLALVFLVIAVRPETLPLRVYTSADGLATSVIHTIIRDSDGFLWIGGRGGLSRFDGQRFTAFSIDEEISSPLIHSIIESRDRKSLWVATNDAVYRILKDRDVTPAIAANQGNIQVRKLRSTKVLIQSFWCLYEEMDGTLLAGSASGLFHITFANDGATAVEKIDYNRTLDAKSSRAIRGFTTAADGSLWLSGDSGLVRRLPDGKWIVYEIPRLLSVGMESYSILSDTKGRIWMSSRTGLHVLMPRTAAASAPLEDANHIAPKVREVAISERGTIDYPTLPDEMIRLDFEADKQPTASGSVANSAVEGFYLSQNGRLHIPTRFGFYIVDGDRYERIADDRLLPGLSKQVTEDSFGNLWFGTFSGAVKYERLGLTSFSAMSGFPEPNIHSIQEAADGKLLVSHGTWKVSVLNDGRFEHFPLRLPENARYSWTAFPVVADSAGSFWALETNGLYRVRAASDIAATLSGKGEPVTNINDAIPYRAFYRAFNDSKGNIIFSTGGQAERKPLIRFDPRTGAWEDLSTLPGLPAGRTVASFAEDSAGNLWFGFYASGGLVRFDGQQFTEFGLDEGLPPGSFLSLAIDKSGRLWMGSNTDGIGRIDDPTAPIPTVKRFTEKDGLTSDNIRCLTTGAEGTVYAGTVRGVSVIDTGSDRISRITTQDGLASDFVQAAYRDSRGIIWFGTANGLSRYIPRERIAALAPQVWIMGLTIAGNRYNVSEFGQLDIPEINVSYAENNVEIEFATNGEAATTRYQYMIAESDPNWSAPSERSSITFANLSPGSYRFLVRAVSDSTEPSEPASVYVVVSPPFWQTWWFAASMLILAAGAVFALDRYRVKKTRQVESALSLSRESENRFRTLADTASDAILTIDAESTIIFVNEAVEKVFGYSPYEIIGKKLPMLMPKQMRDGHNNGLARYAMAGVRRIDWAGVSLPGLHKDGREIPLEVSFGEFERDGERYFTGIARDVSERKRAELALQESRDERLRELERVRTRIATDLHDDIGSSLTQIAVLSEVARSQAVHAKADALASPLERIKSVSRNLVDVMSDVVWAINPQKDNLHDLVLRMRRFGSDVFSSRGIAFEFEVPGFDRDVQLGANIRREIFAIYKETVNNAVKYSECTHASCELTINEVVIELVLSDNGKGFDPAIILSDNFRPEMGGNGLVSIRRRAVDLGGSCEIVSSPGKGTTVTVHVPQHDHDTMMPNSQSNGH